jgi:hypothetical protein
MLQPTPPGGVLGLVGGRILAAAALRRVPARVFTPVEGHLWGACPIAGVSACFS